MTEEKTRDVHGGSLPLSVSSRQEVSDYILGALREAKVLDKSNPPPTFLDFSDKSEFKYTVRVQRASPRARAYNVVVDPKGRGKLAVLDMSAPNLRAQACLAKWVIKNL